MFQQKIPTNRLKRWSDLISMIWNLENLENTERKGYKYLDFQVRLKFKYVRVRWIFHFTVYICDSDPQGCFYPQGHRKPLNNGRAQKFSTQKIFLLKYEVWKNGWALVPFYIDFSKKWVPAVHTQLQCYFEINSLLHVRHVINIL